MCSSDTLYTTSNNIPFCPNPQCHCHWPEIQHHLVTHAISWYKKIGDYKTHLHGPVQRYRCLFCGKTFSSQTFSLDYYVKRLIPYDQVERQLQSCSNTRKAAENLCCSRGSIANRYMRISHQHQAIQAQLQPYIVLSEDLVSDGFESYVVSKYHPNNINFVSGYESDYVYGIHYSQLNRKGAMTASQKRKAQRLKRKDPLPKHHLQTEFGKLMQLINTFARNLPRELVIHTDEKKEYEVPISLMNPKVLHQVTPSTEPRTKENPLRSVNVLDREYRKDIAEHVRKTVCHGRDVNEQMERIISYVYLHNYTKKYRANDPVSLNWKRHHHVAGIPTQLVQQFRREEHTCRRFLSHCYATMQGFQRDTWLRKLKTPEKEGSKYLPKYLQGFVTEGEKEEILGKGFMVLKHLFPVAG